MKREVAILIPCYNEAQTIEKVVKDFRYALSDSIIYVYDNNSSDETARIAEKAGAIVRHECRQGKGNVIRTMFADVDADIYFMVDGDDTYPADAGPKMMQIIAEGKADMVIGDRLSGGTYQKANKRAMHGLGNSLVRTLVNLLFGANLHDIMTGYRAFNRAFVKNLPIMATGFEIETEMTIHALDKKFLIAELPIDYRDRPQGSSSKLNTYSDGIKVIKTILHIFKDYRPFLFFGLLSLFFLVVGFLCGVPVLYEYFSTGFILHIPLAILASALEILAALCIFSAMILDTLVRADKVNYALRLTEYLSNNGKFKKVTIQ